MVYANTLTSCIGKAIDHVFGQFHIVMQSWLPKKMQLSSEIVESASEMNRERKALNLPKKTCVACVPFVKHTYIAGERK